MFRKICSCNYSYCNAKVRSCASQWAIGMPSRRMWHIQQIYLAVKMSPNRFLLGTQYTTATFVTTPNAGGSTSTTVLTFYDPRCRTSINLNQPRSRCLEYFTTMLPSTRFRHNSIIIFKLQIQCAIRQIDFYKIIHIVFANHDATWWIHQRQWHESNP